MICNFLISLSFGWFSCYLPLIWSLWIYDNSDLPHVTFDLKYLKWIFVSFQLSLRGLMSHKTSPRSIPQTPRSHTYVYLRLKNETYLFFYYFDLLLMKIPKSYQHNYHIGPFCYRASFIVNTKDNERSQQTIKNGSCSLHFSSLARLVNFSITHYIRLRKKCKHIIILFLRMLIFTCLSIV